MNLPFITILCFYFLPLEASFKREKRYLLYSLQGSKIQLIFGTGVPIHLEKMSATIGWVIKSAYLMPTNASIYTNPYGSLERKRRSLSYASPSRYELYRAFERKVLSFHSAGRDCLLKAICEASRIPFRSAGLLGKLITVFFLPSATEEEPETEADRSYNAAENHGVYKEQDCNSLYPTCDLHLIDILSVVI